MKNTLIINHTSMINVGGIEKYVCRLTQYLIQNDMRVIWLCDETPRVAKSFRNIMLSNKVERVGVKCHNLNWYKVPKMTFEKDENVVIVSFEPIEMSQTQKLLKIYKDISMKSIYIVPDTTGNRYYVERYFKGLARKIVYAKVQKAMKRWNNEGAIRFFSITQIKPLEKNYKVTIENKQEKILKNVFNTETLRQEKILKKAKERSPFNIITVGRFDFPHKGYMLGLVRAFGRLKSKYPEIQLFIIGFGKDEKKLLDEINKQNTDVKKSITLLGEVAPDDLYKYMENMHLNISVAGAVGDGARNGVISIPARNYCEGECEVYGFLPESRNLATSLAPGKNVDEYIERVLNFSNEEFLEYTVKAYNTYKEENADPLFVFNTVKGKTPLKVNNRELFFFLILSYLIKIKDKMRNEK